MIDQSKKAILMAKLLALNQTVANLKTKCQRAWLIIKQTWYIPFLWSLAWFSYWIFHSAIVLKAPFYGGNNLNYVGAAISIAALLIAGYNARRPIRKSIGITVHSLFRKPIHTTQTEHPKKPEPDLEQIPRTEIRQAQKEISPKMQQAQMTAAVTSFSSNYENKPALSQAHKDFSSECLTCPNLINCTYRQKRTVELCTQNGNNNPCPYTSVVTKRNALKP